VPLPAATTIAEARIVVYYLEEAGKWAQKNREQLAVLLQE
jgi:hypothetical protein